jgi:hypothetical protein
MPTISIPDDVNAQAAARAADAGYASVEEYVAALVRAEASGAPGGLTVGDDEELRSLVESRLDGPWVEVTKEDFEQMRSKFRASLAANDPDGPPSEEPRP